MSHRHVYGPVPSRRLGRSLGVDVIPFKTCTYDCVYCQLGHTTDHTLKRAPYVAADTVLAELAEHLARDTPDIISFAGSGEPTLNSELGACIRGVKAMTDVPVAVFTNSSLLWMPEVRDDLAQADAVSPSLDAALPATAEALNRLPEGLSLDTVLDGLRAFCASYRGRIAVEILLVRGVNDDAENLAALGRALRTLPRYDAVQLNTATRPPADRDVVPLTRTELEAAGEALGVPFEIIASWHGGEHGGDHGGEDAKAHGYSAAGTAVTDEDVLELVRCHPSTAEGVAMGLRTDEATAARHLAALEARGAVLAERREDGVYYMVRES